MEAIIDMGKLVEVKVVKLNLDFLSVWIFLTKNYNL